ncbi:hypothetical protein BH10ACI3_BH10ACI3_12090 [soil metagenome]
METSMIWRISKLGKLFVWIVGVLFLTNFADSQDIGPQKVSDIPFTIELKGKVGMISPPTYYIFLEKEYFNRANLMKIFHSLTSNQNRVINATLFTDKEILFLEAKADSIPVPDYPSTPKGQKALEEFYGNVYAHPKTGYLRAFYSNNGSTEYVLYSPQADNVGQILVTIKSTRKLEITDAFLMNAVKDGYLDGVKWYLSKSNRVDIKDENGMTPLAYALALQHLEIAKCLTDSGSFKKGGAVVQ